MRIKSFLLFLGVISVLQICNAQEFIKTSALFANTSQDNKAGTLNIIQDPAVDTLISRYIYANRYIGGMVRFRIQIFRSGERNAQEEANKVNARFMTEFPEIHSETLFERPNWFLVRVGNYRTKVEGTKQLFLVRKKFPNAYMVQEDKIKIQALNNK